MGLHPEPNKPQNDLYMACAAIRNATVGMHHFALSVRASAVAAHVAAGHLDKDSTRTALLDAAQVLVEERNCNCTLEQVSKAIDDALASVLEEKFHAHTAANEKKQRAESPGGIHESYEAIKEIR